MIRFVEQGTSLGAVNMPQVDLRLNGLGPAACRLLNVHKNIPGVLNKINQILSEFNIDKLICDSRGLYAYVVADVDTQSEDDLTRIYERIYRIPESIATRIVY